MDDVYNFSRALACCSMGICHGNLKFGIYKAVRATQRLSLVPSTLYFQALADMLDSNYVLSPCSLNTECGHLNTEKKSGL